MRSPESVPVSPRNREGWTRSRCGEGRQASNRGSVPPRPALWRPETPLPGGRGPAAGARADPLAGRGSAALLDAREPLARGRILCGLARVRGLPPRAAERLARERVRLVGVQRIAAGPQ